MCESLCALNAMDSLHNLADILKHIGGVASAACRGPCERSCASRLMRFIRAYGPFLWAKISVATSSTRCHQQPVLSNAQSLLLPGGMTEVIDELTIELLRGGGGTAIYVPRVRLA